MAVASPQLFPTRIPEEMIPRDVFTLEKVKLFYILDCQDTENIDRINQLAKLFFDPRFVHCVRGDNGISRDQVSSHFGAYMGPDLDATGRIARTSLKHLHVIGLNSFDKLSQNGGFCPSCHKKVNLLITCPLWEKKLENQSRDINWSSERSPLAEAARIPVPTRRLRSLSVTQEFSTVHFIFLLEMAFCQKDPQDAISSNGIIKKFLDNDCEYATKVLDSLRKEQHLEKARTWIHFIQARSDLAKLRGELYSFLTHHVFPRDYRYKAYSTHVLTNFEGVTSLETINSYYESLYQPSEMPKRPLSSFKRRSSIVVEEGRCLPVRYVLIGILFVFTFLYFARDLLTSFFKGRFLFGEDM